MVAINLEYFSIGNFISRYGQKFFQVALNLPHLVIQNVAHVQGFSQGFCYDGGIGKLLLHARHIHLSCLQAAVKAAVSHLGYLCPPLLPCLECVFSCISQGFFNLIQLPL